MTVYLTLSSGNELVIGLVGDFARGLGCAVEVVSTAAGRGVRIDVPDTGHVLIELLTQVALSATKVGVDVAEPLCHLTYRHEGVPSEVKMAIRVTEFDIATATVAGG